jgi:hypothetical protein
MIFLGLILMGAGYFAHLPILWVLGGIIAAFTVLKALGAFSDTKSRNCETCDGERQYRRYFPAEDDSIGAMEEGDNWEWKVCDCSQPVQKPKQ